MGQVSALMLRLTKIYNYTTSKRNILHKNKIYLKNRKMLLYKYRHNDASVA